MKTACIFQFLFIEPALITGLFTVLKQRSKKQRTYLLHRHGQDNAAGREQRDRN